MRPWASTMLELKQRGRRGHLRPVLAPTRLRERQRLRPNLAPLGWSPGTTRLRLADQQ